MKEIVHHITALFLHYSKKNEVHFPEGIHHYSQDMMTKCDKMALSSYRIHGW